MGYRAAVLGMAGVAVVLGAGPAAAEVADPATVPPRTAISLRSVVPGVRWGTANETETRAGLSISKLYLADYALRHGDGSAEDKELGERMIRNSDDGAAEAMAAKYPYAIDEIAAEYELKGTSGAGGWGMSSTTTADVADFLAAKQRREPDSPLLRWMATASEVAADGTVQDWGTSQVPGVTGTKWGWSDLGVPEVASASIGPGFTVSAHTYGTAAEQTRDVLAVVPEVVGELYAACVPWPLPCELGVAIATVVGSQSLCAYKC
ncbi:hypothetical protein [Nocardia huaxiensis]|uniref:Serine hydrolase n=1 Tax=Nocardia huaxiensis TaxID=2755382 RepID=A0A7D6VE85_9NOCA|nr:hypothetical protein [Nocardia huaxiensis]QLY33334.1 hypothetical protein H0264_14835 [Nocardia huaxiensis]UFS99757.1 hypothetical protein LPY97_18700 [Nocardia huaxiensis]